MKRILSLTLSLALVLTAASAGFARDVAKDTRLNFEHLGSPLEPISTTGMRADTFFLFAGSGPGSYGSAGTNARGFTFDNAGGPATAGWTTVDVTAQPDAYWHLQALTLSNGHATDFQSAAGLPPTGGPGGDTVNDYAWWCGRANVCGWINPTGYGGGWNQWLELTVPVAATAGSLEFDYVGDFEGDVYDFFTLYSKTGANDPVELLSNAVSGEQIVTHYGPIAFGNIDKLIFAFVSDGGWSDEDGSFITDIGAVWIDNIEIDYTGATDVAWNFESGNEADFPALDATFPAGAGAYGALYANLFSEDICITNSTYAWAFFDLNTTNPEYPIPVTPYGPPYFENGIQSPMLEKAHMLGDPVGMSFNDAHGSNSQFVFSILVYWDMPLNTLVFLQSDVAARTVEVPCLGQWANNNIVYYGGGITAWLTHTRDYTLQLATSAGAGNTIDGAVLRLKTLDMCPFWCNVYGDGTGHTPAPYMDVISARLINTSSIAWDIDVFHRFQDNFPEVGGTVRIDSAIDVQPVSGTTLVIGDSTKIKLNMDGNGGIKQDLTSVPGETRPSLYMHFRVAAGPHAGSTSALMSDPDATDGIYSPRIGTTVVNGETWNVAVADTARYQGTISPGSYAFDLAEDYFVAGDVIQLYYKGTAVDNTMQTRPAWAESSNPDLRSYYIVRCLPTAGATMLLCDDDFGNQPWWDEAFLYNGYAGYDVYATQAPSSGLHNGLGGRAEVGDIDQYDVIVWDSGDLPSYTIQNALPDDLTFDDVLLDDWLRNSAKNTCLWVMGNEVANDLDNEASFLNINLGATHILDGSHYNDVTGILVPQVKSVHPALLIGGQQPTFRVDAGCPFVRNLDLVEKNDAMAVDAMAWSVVTGAPTSRAGIYNTDPDGNGLITSPGGYTNRTLFNPFGYYEVWDEGFGIPQGYDYARRMVGDVLTNLCGFEANSTPNNAGEVPASFALKGNFPNPFNPKTTIRFALAASEHVHLNVYDLGGRLVKTLVDEPMTAANHEVVWDGTDSGGAKVASGVYFYKLVAGDFNATEKMVMLK
ncbi:T9SS type A sorting domain-containing protein [bacterium]|nr:T9SS type A sorting domain-containing protein [bacterium]